MICQIWDTYASAYDRGRAPSCLWEGEIQHMPRPGDMVEIEDRTREVLVSFWNPVDSLVTVRVK